MCSDPTSASPYAVANGNSQLSAIEPPGASVTGRVGRTQSGTSEPPRHAPGRERVRELVRPLLVEDELLDRVERARVGLPLRLEDGASEDHLRDPAALRRRRGGPRVVARVPDDRLGDDRIASSARRRDVEGQAVVIARGGDPGELDELAQRRRQTTSATDDERGRRPIGARRDRSRTCASVPSRAGCRRSSSGGDPAAVPFACGCSASRSGPRSAGRASAPASRRRPRARRGSRAASRRWCSRRSTARPGRRRGCRPAPRPAGRTSMLVTSMTRPGRDGRRGARAGRGPDRRHRSARARRHPPCRPRVPRPARR